MGNCTERFTERDRVKHSTKEKNKNSKNFISFTDEDSQLPMMKEFLPNLRALLKELRHEKHKFQNFYENAPEETDKRTLVEVQKAIDVCKPSCLRRKLVMVRVSSEGGRQVFDTQFIDFELPVWNHFFELPGDQNGLIRFEVLRKRARGGLKAVGECFVDVNLLLDQKVFFKWVNLEKMKPGLKGMILVKIQRIFDEKALYLDLFNTCKEKIEKIKEFIKRSESSL